MSGDNGSETSLKENMGANELSEVSTKDVQAVSASDSTPKTSVTKSKRGFSFWMCFTAVMISMFLISFDVSGVSVALPIIVQDLKGVEFEWVGSAYTLSATALLPLSGGLAQVFGRRKTILFQTFFFAVGSAMCGAAPSMNVLIAGRAVQGIGAGGMIATSQIIVADLVPLHERGTLNGLLSLAYIFGAIISPVIAGALAQNGQWRWFFYMNLPFCALSALLAGYFLRLKTPRLTLREKLFQLDWIGNFIAMGSTTASILGLTWAGIVAPWGSARVLVPLILGICGLFGFMIYEALRPANPLVPLVLLSNRTSVSGYFQSACAAFCLITIFYYLPVFFEACKGTSPVGTGVDAFASSFVIMPIGIAVGMSVTKTGKYKIQICVAWVFVIVGLVLLSTVHQDTSRSAILGYLAIFSAGLGPLISALPFPILAPLSVSLNANALAFYSFVRYFSQVWGVTVGGTILQNELTSRLPSEFTSQFPQGTAIAYSIIPVIPSLQETFKLQVQTAFADSIRFIWIATAIVAALGLLAGLLMKSLPLNQTLDERWGLDELEKKNDEAA